VRAFSVPQGAHASVVDGLRMDLKFRTRATRIIFDECVGATTVSKLHDMHGAKMDVLGARRQ